MINLPSFDDMSLSHAKTVSNTHCYVYDPTSHEECDVEDSSRMNQQNKSSEVNRTQKSSTSAQKMDDRRDHYSDSSTRTEKVGDRNLPSGSKDDRQNRSSGSSLSKDRSSANPQDRGRPRSGASKDRSSGRDDKMDELIILSDDSTTSSSKHGSRVRHRRRSRPRSRSSHHIVIKDQRFHNHRQFSRAPERRGSRERHGRSRSKGKHGDHSRHRSSRSIDRKNQHRSRSADRRHDHHHMSTSPAADSGSYTRTGELQELKERIENLKAEINQTKMERDEYLRRNDRLRYDTDMYFPARLSPSPPPFFCPGDRLLPPSDIGRSTDLFRHADDVPPPQRVDYAYGAAVDIPRDMPRDKKSADKLRGEMPVPSSKQSMPPKPRSR